MYAHVQVANMYMYTCYTCTCTDNTMDSTSMGYLVQGTYYLGGTGTRYLDSTGTGYLDSTGTGYLDSTGMRYLDSTCMEYLDGTGMEYLDSTGMRYLDSTGTVPLKKNFPFPCSFYTVIFLRVLKKDD